MRHVICRLTFHTAVRFGSDNGGIMTSTRLTFRTDVLFSALFRALLLQGKSEELLHAVQSSELFFSDAFPWHGDRFFLPRPVGIVAKQNHPAAVDPSQRKLLKKITFIPTNLLKDYLHGQADLQVLYDLNHFGKRFEETRVNMRDNDQPLPYQVSGFRFAKETGLYLVISATDSALALFETAMRALSAEGIGGKVSSGWGKFAFEMIPAAEKWVDALNNEHASCQMLLSTALPSEEEMAAALDGAYYTVVRRGGFAFSEQNRPLKKQTSYLLGSGSTFQCRFGGILLDVGIGMPHPVWRYARAMFMGVEI